MFSRMLRNLVTNILLRTLLLSWPSNLDKSCCYNLGAWGAVGPSLQSLYYERTKSLEWTGVLTLPYPQVVMMLLSRALRAGHLSHYSASDPPRRAGWKGAASDQKLESGRSSQEALQRNDVGFKPCKKG